MMRWSIATLCLSGLLLWASWQPETAPTTLQWTTIDGKTVRLSDLRDAKAVVFITLSTRCPAVPRYAPRLNRLYETYHPRGVAFYGIYPEADETLEGIRAHAQQLGFKFPVVRHGAVSIARAVGATHVPQAFVLNRKGEVAYSGAIDSVTKREVVQHQYLRDVLHLLRHPRPQSEDLVSNPSGYLIDACALILGTPLPNTNRASKVHYLSPSFRFSRFTRGTARGAPTRFPLRAGGTLRRGSSTPVFCELWLGDWY